MTAEDIRALRCRLRLTQAAFAARYQLPLRTLQNYEQGRKAPPAAALTLLKLIDRNPTMIALLLDARILRGDR